MSLLLLAPPRISGNGSVWRHWISVQWKAKYCWKWYEREIQLVPDKLMEKDKTLHSLSFVPTYLTLQTQKKKNFRLQITGHKGSSFQHVSFIYTCMFADNKTSAVCDRIPSRVCFVNFMILFTKQKHGRQKKFEALKQAAMRIKQLFCDVLLIRNVLNNQLSTFQILPTDYQLQLEG